jgi:transposase InsO family protein
MAFLHRKKKRRGSSPQETASPVRVGKKRKICPVEVKLLAVDALQAGLTAAEVSELVGVSATALARWRRLHREGGEKALMRQATHPGARRLCSVLERRIEQMRREHPEAGVRKIRDELKRDHAVAVSAETVRRVVNDAGLGNPPVQAKRRPPQVRRFEKELPNALWQIDIFTFQLKRMYPVYLIGIIDDHSRYIVGHGLYRQQNADAVLEVVKGAIGQWGAPREILSDNGRQFAAWRGQSRFQKVLKRQGIGHVRSAPHHPMTLGKIERFWKTIWTEFLEEACFASFADARQRLDHWINYYNHQRPHQGIDGLCPADRFYGVADDVEEALRHGCRENALQLALGQETRPPLYLLGKLGETDVRVTRRGEEIEVKLGDEVHEVIRLAAPFTVDEQGRYQREEVRDEVEGLERRGTISGGAAGPEGRSAREGTLQDLRRDPPDVEDRHGESRSGGYGRVNRETAGEERKDPGREETDRFAEEDREAGERTERLANQVRDRHDLRGTSSEGVEWGGASRGRDDFYQKKKDLSISLDPDPSEDAWPELDEIDPGRDDWSPR